MLRRQEPAEVVDPEEDGEQSDLPQDPPGAAALPVQIRQCRLPDPLQSHLRHADPHIKPNARSLNFHPAPESTRKSRTVIRFPL